MWERWKAGDSLQQIAQLFDRSHSSVEGILSRTGGIPPPERRRSPLALSLDEREEISRATGAGFSIRAIASVLGRAPSTVSREIKRNGGREGYRATQADQAAWDRGHRPKRCELAENRALARIVAARLQSLWAPEQIAGWLKHTYWNGRLLSLASAGCHSERGRSCPAPTRRRQLMTIVTIGLDLAKNVFQVHGVDERGIAVLRKQLKRDQIAAFFARLEPCLVGVEACGGAHYWAAKLGSLGHRVKMMAPQFVKPYVKTNKNDALDAEAICEAVTRPNMHFVPIKSPEQQSVLSLHTVREGLVHARTAQANQIRGLLAEFGHIVPQGIRHIYARVPEVIEDASNELPVRVRLLIDRLLQHLKALDRQVQELEKEIELWHRSSEVSRRLETIPGIGPITASALVASAGDPRNFKSARQFAAWIGLVPHQNSSGGKTRLLGISKRGNVYLRTLLVHGGRAMVQLAKTRTERAPTWLGKLVARRHHNIAAVAMANKNARLAWALLSTGKAFEPEHVQAPVA
jgi:transposase